MKVLNYHSQFNSPLPSVWPQGDLLSLKTTKSLAIAGLFHEVRMEIIVGEATAQLGPFINDGISDEAAARIRYLSHLYVPKESRRQGHASALIEQIGKEADEAQIAILTQPAAYDDGEMTTLQLEAFYAINGYIKLQDNPLIMVRYPKPPLEEKRKEGGLILDNQGQAIH